MICFGFYLDHMSPHSTKSSFEADPGNDNVRWPRAQGLQSQIQGAGHVLDVELSLLYLPDVALIGFNDSSTGTSHIKLIRQGSTLDIGKQTDAFHLYWQVLTSPARLTTPTKWNAPTGSNAAMR